MWFMIQIHGKCDIYTALISVECPDGIKYFNQYSMLKLAHEKQGQGGRDRV